MRPLRSDPLRADPSSAVDCSWPHARGGGGAQPVEEWVRPISGRLMQPIKGEKDAASLTEINFGRTDLMEFGRKKKENPEESS